MSAKKAIRVLIIDDSAVLRQVMVSILSRESDMEVVVAQEPLIAMRKMKDALPDVILLDLEMPRMDGLTFLRHLRASHDIPVIICSAFSGANRRAAVEALEYGAIDIVKKPELGLRGFLDESAKAIVELVRAAAASAHRPRKPIDPIDPAELEKQDKYRHRFSADAVLPRPRAQGGVRASSERIIAIGASTGGTAALHHVLGKLPPDCPPVAVVQHMPAGFTLAFAQRLDETCRIRVSEARDGDALRPGTALIAPGDHHLIVVHGPDGYHAQVRSGPAVNRHRPSVDVLFRSVAAAAGPSSIGVLLTGMGDDGAAGLLEMRLAGASTVAEDQTSCVVYGMPKEAVARGAVETMVPLSRIAATVMAAAQEA